MSQTYSLLALGDSYTIGESLPIYESFPYQTVQILRRQGHQFYAPEIIAKTGWTTDELATGISQSKFLTKYDFVTLLIGVNNQYRGRPAEEYKLQLAGLMEQAIRFAGNDPSHVIVLSIPDWGITPFAKGRDQQKISNEIDGYNLVNKTLSAQRATQYIDITPGTREAAADGSLLAADKLHPSGKEYARWSERVAKMISTRL